MKALFIYAIAWFSALAAAFAVYLNGAFGEAMIAIFGFIFATLFAAGILMVIPFLVDEHYTWNY